MAIASTIKPSARIGFRGSIFQSWFSGRSKYAFPSNGCNRWKQALSFVSQEFRVSAIRLCRFLPMKI